MGYFSNGTEGMIWEAENCNKCLHQNGGCSVLLLQQLHNYNATDEQKKMLDFLIPRSKDHLSNEPCKMLVKRISLRETTDAELDKLADFANAMIRAPNDTIGRLIEKAVDDLRDIPDEDHL